MAQAWQTEQKNRTKHLILAAAAKLLRGQGMRGTSVAKLMQEAGLTVGGFYAHFRSKEALILEAFRAMMQKSAERIDALPTDPRERVKHFYSYYLSQEHRDSPETGCPIIPLVFEAGAGNAAFRKKFSEELEKTFKARAKQFQLDPESEKQMLVHFATLLGAQLLARATRGTKLSDQVLGATLKSMLEKTQRSGA
jgi:TetR/AcrR family transcriptional repressor of nem operon